jgi:hypothetical protein
MAIDAIALCIDIKVMNPILILSNKMQLNQEKTVIKIRFVN